MSCGFQSVDTLLPSDAGAGAWSVSLVTDDVGDTITDRLPPRPARDSGLDDLAVAGRTPPTGDDVDAFDDEPLERARSSPDRDLARSSADRSGSSVDGRRDGGA